MRVGGGSMTNVVMEGTVLTERLCDVDGDGSLDNAVGNLGSPNAELLALFLSSLFRGAIEFESRLVIHFPWVDDLRRPADDDLVIVPFDGRDVDLDPSDDFLGAEPFYIEANELDACGEPASYLVGARLTEGNLLARGGVIPGLLSQDVAAHNAELTGTVQPQGAGSDLLLCGYITTHDLGAGSRDGWTLLELFLAGGAPIGMSSVSGLTPDIDVDGDGLERYELDEQYQLRACIDGNRIETTGRECWRDESMADGFSLTMRLLSTSATFAGREPDWQLSVQGSCDAGPPDSSLLDPR